MSPNAPSPLDSLRQYFTDARNMPADLTAAPWIAGAVIVTALLLIVWLFSPRE